MAGVRDSVRNFGRFVRAGGRFGPYLKPRRGSFLVSALLTVLYASVRLLEPWPLQILLDQVVLNQPTQLPGGFDPLAWAGDPARLLLAAAASILVLAVVSGAVYYTQSILVARLGQQVIRDIREDVYHHMLRHSLAFHRRNNPGDLIMRLTGDMMFLREMMLAVMVTMTGEWIVLLSTLALMFWVSAKLTLVTLLIAPALVFLFYFFRSRMREASRKQRKREGRIAQQIGEALLAIPMIQAFTAEQQEDERFRKICKKSERIGVRSAKLEAGMQRLVEILIAVGTCLVMWFGIREILAEQLTPGVFLVFLAYLRALFKPVRKLGKVAERTARASAAAERILEVLETRRDVKDSKKAGPAPVLTGAIEFSALNFTYEDGTVALRDFNARIEVGEQVAITGHSGAGKSTLLSLLLGFHRPSSGKILLDGTSLKRFTLNTVRRQISYLPQEPFLVAGTLRENLCYGDPDASDDAIWAALDQAELGDFVRSLPRGLDTRVPSRGQSLSGGQKQRVAIARAILKDAPILLLDEPTVGLDPTTEQSVLRSLARLRAGRTTLTIAHRPGTIENADRVLEIKDGCLIRDERRSEPTGTDPDPDADDSSVATVQIENVEDDPAIAGLCRLLGPKGGTRFRRMLKEWTDLRGTTIQVRGRKHRMGQRALLQVTHDGGSLFVKLFRSRSRRPLERVQAAEELARGAGIEVPRTLGWDDRFRALIMEEAAGTPWWDLTAPERMSLVRSFASSLAKLHRADAPTGWVSVETEASRLQRVQLRAEERGSERWTALAKEWREAAARHLQASPPDRRVTPVHGDVYPDQLLAGPRNRAVLLDWDIAGLSTPARDLGNFVAHLDLETLRGRLTAREADDLSRAFLEGGQSDTEFAESVDWHRRSTLLRLAVLYSNPTFGSLPDLSPQDLARRLLQQSLPPSLSKAAGLQGES